MKGYWLRAETKAFERRTPLTPTDAKALMDEGIEVIVESFPDRIYKDKEYEAVGCKIVPSHTWKDAPEDFVILGLKEIEYEDFPFTHKHIYFAHVFKGQDGYLDTLKRYKNGGGVLYDLEYLTDASGRRISAFGYWAGWVGAALSAKAYYRNGDLSPLKSYETRQDFIQELLMEREKSDVGEVRAIIIGSLGRCGRGAFDALTILGADITTWDRKNTAKGGPFDEILSHDIFVNAILAQVKIPPFLTKEILQGDNRLKVVGDVSCDPTSDLNPLPIYESISSWEEPLHKKEYGVNPTYILAVDNLPSILPRESSEDFSMQLKPHLLNFFKEGESNTVWSNARNVFNQHTKSLT